MDQATEIEHLHVVVIDDDDDHAELARVSVRAALRGACERLELSVFSHPRDVDADAIAGPCVFLCDDKLAADWLPHLVALDLGPAIAMTSRGHEEIAATAVWEGSTDRVNGATVCQGGQRLRSTILDARRQFDLERTARELTRQLEIAKRDLRIKGERLDSLSNSTHRFVEDVAHEFRTPLAVIQEFASIMADGIGGQVTPKHGEFLEFIGNATRDLAQLVDDFLDSGKLRAGTLRVDRRVHSVDEVLDASWSVLAQRAKAHGITLERDVPDDLSPVWIDVDKARRTLTNLLINAVKYSPANATVTIRAASHGPTAVRLMVIDRGPGMNRDECERLLDRFRHGDAAHVSQTKSCGLGLNIVRELTGINLGVAEVSSELGVGSTFAFTMPRAETASIVRHYVDWIGSLDLSDTITVLHVSAGDPVTQQELLSFLGSVSRTTDLELPDASGDGVYLVGVGHNPGEWAARLETLYQESALRVIKQTDRPLRVRRLGVCRLPNAEAFLTSKLTNRVEIAAHA